LGDEMKYSLNFDRRIPKVKNVYSETIEELERPRTLMYLDLLSKAMAKRQEAEKKFVTEFKNKEVVIKEYSKYERLVYYIFERWFRESKKYGSA